jgi:hypothetical protein
VQDPSELHGEGISGFNQLVWPAKRIMLPSIGTFGRVGRMKLSRIMETSLCD